MFRIEEYTGTDGRSPYAGWFERLNARAATRVTTNLIRMEQGNLSSVKGVGEGIFESRIDFGPGCRIYFGRDGEALIILLGGGIKSRQQRDIETARARWREYKRRKRQES